MSWNIMNKNRGLKKVINLQTSSFSIKEKFNARINYCRHYKCPEQDS